MFFNPGLNPAGTAAPGPNVAGMAAPSPAPGLNFSGEPVENEDGGVDFVDDQQQLEPADVGHDANLAEVLDDSILSNIANDLIEGIDADKASNAEMYSIFDEGLKFVVCKPGARLDKPFPGAAGAIHPIALEALVRFQANARGELLPADGPVKMEVFGDDNPDTEARARRKRDWMNYYLTQKDEGYYDDYDQMLLLVGLYGSMFRKIYRNPGRRGMPESRALTPRDLIVSASATDLAGSGRVTHAEPDVSHADLIKLQLKSWYRNIEIPLPGDADETAADAMRAETEGREKSDRPEDETYTLLHCHTLLDIEGLEHRTADGKPTGLPLPYIVTIEPESRTILRISRNWAEDDDEFNPREYYVHYKYMPGLGFYGWGLLHLLGSTVDALTMLRRQAINGLTLKMHPGGLRAKGGAKSEQSRISIGPGDFVEIETGGLPIQQAIMPMPYADIPASYTPLVEEIVSSGQRLGSVGDMAVGEGREDALPGTVIALIEQAVKLEAGVLKRLHTAQRKELRLLADLFGADQDAKYPYFVGGQKGQALAADFADNEDIVPVSDPNIPTQTQRLAQAQAILAMARQPGSKISVNEAETDFLRTLGRSDQEVQRLMPPPGQGQPSDPVTEFAAALKSMPLAAGPQQNHAAHIQAHLAQLSTPGLDKTPVYQALISHVGDHMGLFYAGEAARLTGIPMQPGQIPPGQEATVAQAVAAASDQLRISLAQFAPPGGDPLMAQKLQLEAKKLAQQDQKMILDAHEQDRKAAQDHADRQADMTKLAATLADSVQQRQTEMAVNTQETIRGVMSLHATELQAGADVTQEQLAHDTAIAEKLIEHATERDRAKADVRIAEHDHRASDRQAKADEVVAEHGVAAEQHRVKSEQAKAGAARAKASAPRPKAKK